MKLDDKKSWLILKIQKKLKKKTSKEKENKLK